MKFEAEDLGWKVWVGVFRLPRLVEDRKRVNCSLSKGCVIGDEHVVFNFGFGLRTLSERTRRRRCGELSLPARTGIRRRW